MKQDKVPGSGFFHTLDFKKKPSASGDCVPWTSPGAFCSPLTPTLRLFDFPPFPSLLNSPAALQAAVRRLHPLIQSAEASLNLNSTSSCTKTCSHPNC